MLALIGLLLVLVAVLGGFLLEKGNLFVLMQPAEIFIIVGAATGIVLVANPWTVIRKMLAGVIATLRRPPPNRDTYLRHLQMLYEILVYAQRSGGVVSLEHDVEEPADSAIFSSYSALLRDRAACDFLCDSLRMLVIGATSPEELDGLMELDIEAQRRGRLEPVNALNSVADSLPGLGIVAAVLGVVITMEAIGGAADSVGQKVAAALVGTFLGILLCYGVVGPLAARLENLGEAQGQLLQVMRIALLSFARGSAPILAIEYARRSIDTELRPSFVDMEACIKRDARIPSVPKPGQSGQPPPAEEADAPTAET